MIGSSGGSRPSDNSGAWSSSPWDKGEWGGLKKFFSSLRASVWSKNKGEAQAPPLDPPLGSMQCFSEGFWNTARLKRCLPFFITRNLRFLLILIFVAEISFLKRSYATFKNDRQNKNTIACLPVADPTTRSGSPRRSLSKLSLQELLTNLA